MKLNDYWISDKIRIRYREGTSDLLVIKEVFNGYRVKEVLSEDSIVIDLGAHIGVFSISASLIARCGKVFSYEPHLESFNLLRENIEFNGLMNVFPFNLGVWREGEEDGALFLNFESPGSSSFLVGNGRLFQKVFCISLREVFDRNGIERCDFLKLDIEGVEYEVLYSLPVDYFNRIGFIGMEYHHLGVRNGNRLKAYLERVGYSVEIEQVTEELGFLYARRM